RLVGGCNWGRQVVSGGRAVFGWNRCIMFHGGRGGGGGGCGALSTCICAVGQALFPVLFLVPLVVLCRGGVVEETLKSYPPGRGGDFGRLSEESLLALAGGIRETGGQ